VNILALLLPINQPNGSILSPVNHAEKAIAGSYDIPLDQPVVIAKSHICP
jgi:hypothetical protein